MFLLPGVEASRVEGAELSKWLRAKPYQFKLDKIFIRMRRAKNRIFTNLEYYFLHSRHISHSKDEKQQRSRQVQEVIAKFFVEADNGEFHVPYKKPKIYQR